MFGTIGGMNSFSFAGMKRMATCLPLAMVTLLLLTSAVASAQDDNWWRKLFRKDTVEEHTVPATVPVDSPEVSAPTDPPERFPTVYDTVRTPLVSGRIIRNEPTKLVVLDSLYRAYPPEVSGFRIQVYFGNLQQAREVRKGLMERNRDVPCYLVQNPPSFAVQIGDYRTQLDAFRESLLYKQEFPGAIVVPARIEAPKSSFIGQR